MRHLQAIRIVLKAISQFASQSKRYIVPLISLHIDFYVRVFVQVFESASAVKDCASKLRSVNVLLVTGDSHPASNPGALFFFPIYICSILYLFPFRFQKANQFQLIISNNQMQLYVSMCFV